MKAKVNNSITD